ncbi:MAG: hypothetical protein QF807_04645 [Candidatus Thalassarchaeaceae archaeon]|jgi:cell division protein FtsX|nr:hypothetical protein [Candidatus Thalassarchaeaceae archaeon]MDP7043286.1 hypothetical protein [Candidatus Thalassarchaeaceae archaeon]
MSEHGWTPDEVDVKRSEIESKVADIIEDESLTTLKNKAQTGEMTEEMAKAIRSVKGDVRLETTDAEQAHASQVTDVVTWVLVGIAVVIVLVGAAFTIAFSSFI